MPDTGKKSGEALRLIEMLLEKEVHVPLAGRQRRLDIYGVMSKREYTIGKCGLLFYRRIRWKISAKSHGCDSS